MAPRDKTDVTSGALGRDRVFSVTGFTADGAVFTVTRSETSEESRLAMAGREPISDCSDFRRTLLDGEITLFAVKSGKATGASVHSLREKMRITISDIAVIVGMSSRTIMRKEKKSEPLTSAETDRFYRIARVGDLAAQLIGDRDRAVEWLKTPNHYLGDTTPLAMLETEIGTDHVIESLYAIAYGGVA